MIKRRLLLTSGGLTSVMKQKLFDITGKRPENMRVLFLPTAGIATDGAREGIAICLHELARMGIRPEHISVYNLELIISKDYKRTYSAYIAEPHWMTRLLTARELKAFDAVFVGGGDSAVLCREMVRTGFDGALRQAIDEGLVYVGISAGSMYAAGNLDDGLHIIDNPIIPHWNGPKQMALPGGSGEIRLADGQAVYVEGESVCLIQAQ